LKIKEKIPNFGKKSINPDVGEILCLAEKRENAEKLQPTNAKNVVVAIVIRRKFASLLVGCF
jgi:hypothetical protein